MFYFEHKKSRCTCVSVSCEAAHVGLTLYSHQRIGEIADGMQLASSFSLARGTLCLCSLTHQEIKPDSEGECEHMIQLSSSKCWKKETDFVKE
jgi:hypothetical protein